MDNINCIINLLKFVAFFNSLCMLVEYVLLYYLIFFISSVLKVGGSSHINIF